MNTEPTKQPEQAATSDTPRTDKAKRDIHGFADQWVPRYISEELERELSQKHQYWLSELEAKLKSEENLGLAIEQLAAAHQREQKLRDALKRVAHMQRSTMYESFFDALVIAKQALAETENKEKQL